MLHMRLMQVFVGIFSAFLLVTTFFLIVINQLIISQDTNTVKLPRSNPDIMSPSLRGDRMPSKVTGHGYPQDEFGAEFYMRHYRTKFGSGERGVNLTNTANITLWWQAAAMIHWYFFKSPLRYTCENKVVYDNWHVCQDKKYEVKPPCLVYSFGIARNYTFDDALGKLGCEVHSFNPRMGAKDHKMSPNSTFHKLTIGAMNTDGYIPRENNHVKGKVVWKMRTLKSIKKALGHENRVLDVLKLDVESDEWDVVDNMMETNMFEDVRQFLLEFHLFPDYPIKDDYVRCYKVYKRLRNIGFQEFHVRPHNKKKMKAAKFKNQAYSEFVNANFHRKVPALIE